MSYTVLNRCITLKKFQPLQPTKTNESQTINPKPVEREIKFKPTDEIKDLFDILGQRVHRVVEMLDEVLDMVMDFDESSSEDLNIEIHETKIELPDEEPDINLMTNEEFQAWLLD